MITEVIGIVASLIILSSTIFKSTSNKRNIVMRTINALGSSIFVAYGFLINSLSIILLNIILIVIALIHIIILVKVPNKKKSEKLVDSVDIWINKDANLEVIKDGVLGADWSGYNGCGRWQLILDANGIPHIYTEHMDNDTNRDFSEAILKAILDKAIIEE